MRRQLTIALSACFALLAPAARADRAILDASFDDGIAGWSGSGIFHDGLNGHLTPNGTARVLQTGTHSIRSPCVLLDDQPLFTSSYRLEASIRATTSADFTLKMEIHDDPTCTTLLADQVLEDVSVAGDVWVRRHSELSVASSVRSIRFVFQAVSTGPTSFFGSFVDDVQVINRATEELVRNAHFRDNLDHWILRWGDQLVRHGGLGTLGDEGFAVVFGNTEDFAGIDHECIDLSGQPNPQDDFYTTVWINPHPAASEPLSGIFMDYFTDTNCTVRDGGVQILRHIPEAIWSQVEGTFSPAAGIQSIKMVVGSVGAPDGGDTWFDSASIVAMSSVFKDGFESGDTTRWSSTTN